MSVFTLFFDGQWWIGVLEVDDDLGRTHAARHVFGAEPSDVVLAEFLRTHGVRLLEAALAAPAAQDRSHPAGRVNPKRAARLAAREAARPRPSTAAQEALSRSREENRSRSRAQDRERKRQEADAAWRRRRERARRRHRGH